MNKPISKVDANRKLLTDAQAAGSGATLGAFVRLSGPGWLQSAITLGGGSLAGALFLGVLGGSKLLWLQLMAISMGVVMLSAISYVTLSTGERPFRAINRHINPVLGWGWLIATCMANMIWCMPQFMFVLRVTGKEFGAEGARRTDGSDRATRWKARHFRHPSGGRRRGGRDEQPARIGRQTVRLVSQGPGWDDRDLLFWRGHLPGPGRPA